MAAVIAKFAVSLFVFKELEKLRPYYVQHIWNGFVPGGTSLWRGLKSPPDLRL